MRRLLVVTGVAVTVLGAAAPAFAHVSVTPQSAPAGRLQLYTVQVPNELLDQATVEVDVTLPAGFALDVAQSVPGWSTVITRRAGAPVAVAWKGGRIPVGTFASFQIQGRNPLQQGPIGWPTVQRYERTTVTWNGAPTAQDAAPTVRLVAPGTALTTGGIDAPPPVSLSTAQASDQLARSRAALGIALAVLALGLVLGPLSLAFLRRRGAANRQVPTDTGTRAPSTGPGAKVVAAADPRTPARSGRSRGSGG